MVRPRDPLCILAALAIAVGLGAGAPGCGGSDGARRATTAGGAIPWTSTSPVGSAGAPAAPSSSTPAPVASPAAPPPPAGRLAFTVTGPGPARVAADAAEVTALAATVANTGSEDLLLEAVALRAAGALDDATGVTTARLALDADGDGAFDRAVDRVLASAGLAADDGPLDLRPVPLPLAPGASLRLLVTLDLSGRGQPTQDVRLVAAPAPVAARTAAGGPVTVDAAPGATGGALTLGPWVAPFEAVELQGTAEGLRPRARRDAQGRTHLAIFQNLNGRSSVFYALDDGRRLSPPDDVADAPRRAWVEDLAVDAAGLPVLVWEEVGVATPNDQIYLSAFDPAAFAWTAKERVSTSPDGATSARVAAGRVAGQDVVDVVWEERPVGGQVQVLHRRRAGGAWSSVADVTSSAAGARPRDAALAHLPGGELLVAWADEVTGDVRARRLAPAGAWGPVEAVATAQGSVERVELLADAGVVALAYVDGGEVQVVRGGPQGWSAPVNASRSPASASLQPTLAVWQGALQVAWIEEVAGGAHVAHAAAQGGGFTPPVVLTASQGNVSRRDPTLVAEGDRLRVLWQDRRLGRQRIFETWRADPAAADATLEAPVVVAAPGGDPQRPDVALGADGATHVVWSVDAGGAAEVFCATSPAPGAPFAPQENVSRSPAGSHAPTVAACGAAGGAATLVAAWEEDAPGGFAVVRAERGPAGWATPAVVSSGRPAYAPRLAGAADGRAALVWTEQVAPGNHDLRLALRDAGGAWSAPRPVAPRAGASAWSPDVALGAPGAAVAWEEEGGGRREVWTAVVDAAGATTVAAVASSTAGQYAPRLAWSGADLWAAWVEDGRARVAVRRAGQAAFDAPHDLTTGGAWAPALAASGGQVVVTFERWTGGDARVVQAVVTPTGASPLGALDRSAGPARRAAAAGTATAGVVAAWAEPGRVVVRARRAR